MQLVAIVMVSKEDLGNQSEHKKHVSKHQDDAEARDLMIQVVKWQEICQVLGKGIHSFNK